MSAVQELVFRRASVHLVHDAQRLEEGKDLNDALLDFFVKLGQALIPDAAFGGVGAASALPPVAYLGSHFLDVLRKGGVRDGREGHRNVANWATRRLGRGGLFHEDVGALAVPVNEVLGSAGYEVGNRLLPQQLQQSETAEKHWWLALLLNPRAVVQGEDSSLLCLDSFVRSDTRFEPPIRATREGPGDYNVEVNGLSRVGFCVNVHFKAESDGSAGPLPEPRKSRLKAGGREFPHLELTLETRERGGEGRSGRFEGDLGFRLDRRGAAKTGGEYTLEYADPIESASQWQPPLRLRVGQQATAFQAELGRLLGGYLSREWELSGPGSVAGRHKGSSATADAAARVERSICLPGVPQQETSHDCGFFILEQILRALQLTPRALRELATASSVEIAMLPWPSQKQVFRRKALLRDALATLGAAARQGGTSDVEALFKRDPGLRARIRAALRDDGPSFVKGFERWEFGDWDLSPSPSRSSGERSPSRKRRRASSSSSGASSPSRSPARAASPSFTLQELEGRPVGELKRLCVHKGVLPVGAAERVDLVMALAPFAKPQPQPPAQAWPSGKPFTKGDLQAMASKALRTLCIQRGVLPGGPIERGDLIQALTPLAAG